LKNTHTLVKKLKDNKYLTWRINASDDALNIEAILLEGLAIT
jgi:hypothetical protein